MLSFMGRTLAIHWAQTTHGTWLHGNIRGCWRNGRLIGPDPYLEAETRARLSNVAIGLNASERQLVADIFGEVVREQRMQVFAATILATHLHLVFGPIHENIKTVIARFKYRSAAAVFAQRHEPRPPETVGLYSRAVSARTKSDAVSARTKSDAVPALRSTKQSLWTAGQFPVFIFSESHLANAIEYVRDHNRRMDLPADPFDWITPLYPPSELWGERANRKSNCERLSF
jgi:hypothetical protein